MVADGFKCTARLRLREIDEKKKKPKKLQTKRKPKGHKVYFINI